MISLVDFAQSFTVLSMNTKPELYTIGHSTREMSEFVELLQENKIECLVDVRSLPGSTKFPRFNQENLAVVLPQAGIEYVYFKALGGLRKRVLPKDDRRNAWWQNASFKRYADYACTEPFFEAFDQLIALAKQKRCCVMCAEAVWWRCHRRIIADHWLAQGFAVWHIMAPHHIVAASLTEAAHVEGNIITYPAG